MSIARLTILFQLLLISVSGMAQPLPLTENDHEMSIYFGGGSYYIDSQQIEDLDEFIMAIPNFEEYEIEVHSHTDNIGSISFNQYLSEMRSESAIQLLENYDFINRDFIATHDFGELNPSYSNATYNGKLHNRRVDIIIRKIAL